MSKDLASIAKKHLIRYGGEPIEGIFVKAQGASVWDVDGREVLDFTSGQMCATIGHNHPAIVEAIRKSTADAIHLFSGMIPDTVARLAKLAITRSFFPFKVGRYCQRVSLPQSQMAYLTTHSAASPCSPIRNGDDHMDLSSLATLLPWPTYTVFLRPT